eukprot:CAMPEP_0201686782 /NCGR_PEP_ID=MMETSP0578-20130828/1099_1 /ASSEMBLY_ACC=CAM_ASM_000663 /TAXON_ID=267565 /ORGANISM="Skeletonema grethea, Strain CCMP 1804" /LENGTH=175 /DNA_ID=CAMNT_0048170879 /DNA_START=16 /DNA_END=543 /DNA_ORIENTATION=-
MGSTRIIPFCVPLSPGESSGVGVVGTITLRGQSAIVWFGWGAVERRVEEICDDSNNGSDSSTVTVGTGRPPMGSLSLSMPPRARSGSSIMPTPTSQLIGGSSDEDMMLGQQMSARLAKRIGWPIFVSCSFSDFGQNGVSPALAAGFDDDTMPAAMAEKEVTKILTIEKDKLVAST